MRVLHLVTLVMKICFEATSRIIIFSCCLYVTNGGQFSSIKTLEFFYLMLTILIIFHVIFNRSTLYSWKNVLGKRYLYTKLWHISNILYFEGIILNAFNSIITFTSMNYVAILQNIRKGLQNFIENFIKLKDNWIRLYLKETWGLSWKFPHQTACI